MIQSQDIERKSTRYFTIGVLSFLCLLFSVQTAFCFSDTTTIPIYRQLFHDKIDAEQKSCDAFDGKQDGELKVGKNEEVNSEATLALFNRIDQLQMFIEDNAKINSNNDKIRALSFLENSLLKFRMAWKKKEINPAEFPVLIDRLIDIIHALPQKPPPA